MKTYTKHIKTYTKPIRTYIKRIKTYMKHRQTDRRCEVDSIAISSILTVAPRFKNMVPPEGSPLEGPYIAHSLYSFSKDSI